MNNSHLSNIDSELNVDLDIALRKLDELTLADGDLGAEYWSKISRLLRAADHYKSRAIAAEEQLRKIGAGSFFDFIDGNPELR